MQFNLNDYIGFGGVFILLIAFALNLSGRLKKDSIGYIVMNISGAALACLASVLIHYLPFIILEGTWMVVSFFALIKYFMKNKTGN